MKFYDMIEEGYKERIYPSDCNPENEEKDNIGEYMIRNSPKMLNILQNGISISSANPSMALIIGMEYVLMLIKEYGTPEDINDFIFVSKK